MTSAPVTKASIGARTYLIADHIATALFGFEGAATGAAAGLDLLGIVVVGFSTALVGGIIRDLLLGDTPPAALRSPSRIIVALIGCLAGFAVDALVGQMPEWSFVIPDAAALALFAVTGAEKAAVHGSNLWVVTMLGAITGVGGGVLRDMLLNRIPIVLTANIYATAAALGALVVGIALKLKVPPTTAMIVGFVVCFVVRLLAAAFDWQLPGIH